MSSPPSRARAAPSTPSDSTVTALATSRPPAGSAVPAPRQHVVGGDATADEDRVRCRQAVQRVGGPAFHDPHAGHPERVGVGRDARSAGRVGLHGHRPAGRVGPQPLQRDRAVARADVPQQLAAPRPEQRERDGADFTLGELAVVVEGVVREARGEGCGPVRRDVTATRFNGSPGGWAQSRAVPSRRRSPGPPSCSRTVRAESPHPSSASSAASSPGVSAPSLSTSTPGPRREHPAHRGERPPDRADHLDGLRRPPHPGARQRYRRRVREHLHRPEHPRERGAQAVVASGRRWPARTPGARAAPRTARAARAAGARATRAPRRRCARPPARAAAARQAPPRPRGRRPGPVRPARPSRPRRSRRP